MTTTPDTLAKLADFHAWMDREYPDRLDRQGKFRMSSVQKLMEASWLAALTAQALPAAEPVEGFREQHDRDSRELRSLCQARDEARREWDLGRVEIAGLESSVGHLSALVDHQTNLLTQAMQVMKTLHGSAAPDDGPDMDAIISAGAFRQFVDGHARLMHLIHIGPVGTSQTATVEQCPPCKDFDADATCPQCRLIPASEALKAAQQAAQAPVGWVLTAREDDGAITLKSPGIGQFRFYADEDPASKLALVHRFLSAMLSALPQPPQPQEDA